MPRTLNCTGGRVELPLGQRPVVVRAAVLDRVQLAVVAAEDADLAAVGLHQARRSPGGSSSARQTLIVSAHGVVSVRFGGCVASSLLFLRSRTRDFSGRRRPQGARALSPWAPRTRVAAAVLRPPSPADLAQAGALDDLQRPASAHFIRVAEMSIPTGRARIPSGGRGRPRRRHALRARRRSSRWPRCEIAQPLPWKAPPSTSRSPSSLMSIPISSPQNGLRSSNSSVGWLEAARSCAAACSGRGSTRGRGRPCSIQLEDPPDVEQSLDQPVDLLASCCRRRSWRARSRRNAERSIRSWAQWWPARTATAWRSQDLGRCRGGARRRARRRRCRRDPRPVGGPNTRRPGTSASRSSA